MAGGRGLATVSRPLVRGLMRGATVRLGLKCSPTVGGWEAPTTSFVAFGVC